MLTFNTNIVINKQTTVTLSALNENSLLLTWPEHISVLQHQTIIYCQQLLNANKNLHIIDTVVSYNSLLICYHYVKTPIQTLIDYITCLLTNELPHNLSHELSPLLDAKKNQQTKEVIIPVCYNEQYGWDLNEVANATGLTINEIIEKHTSTSYNAYALGFTPGFCYLAKTDNTLHLPRKSTPRIKVPQGAVAIAEQQTAVYPNESPGGWHILGQTPLPMFSLQNGNFIAKINIGDSVRFKAIDQKTFIDMSENNNKDI